MAHTGMRQTYHGDVEIKAFDLGLFRRLLGMLRPFAMFLFFALGLLFLGRLLANATPRVIQYAIDGPIAQAAFHKLWVPVALFFGLKAISFVALFGQVYVTNFVGQNVIKNLRIRLFRHTQSLPMRYFARNPVGRIMSRIVNDTDVLNELFSSGLITVFGDIFTIVFIVGFMLSLHVKLTLVSLSILPVVILVSWLFKLKVRDQFRKIRVATADINTHLQEGISGMAVIRLFNQMKNDAKKFDVHNTRYLNHYIKTILYFSLFFPVMELLGTVALCLIIWYGGLRFMGDGITVGILVAFIEYIKNMFFPIRDLAEKYNILQNAMASSERVFNLLEEKPAVSGPSCPVVPKAVSGLVEFSHVFFSYHPKKSVLEDVTFTVNPGEVVAVVGQTGAGKTTLMHLLNRFYEPASGEIRIDNVNIRDFDVPTLRTLVGTVSQDLFIFSDSVMENIRLGRTDITQERVKYVSTHINADRFVTRLDKGFGAVLAEAGANISVGQKQLLSFARILSYNPKIIILDEATSSVDPATEVLIQEAIGKLTKGRTCLIVAHRLSTIQGADRIVVLHHGRVAETGTHEELMRKEGIYYRLYRLQFS